MNVILTRLMESLKFGIWNVVYLLANSVNTSVQQPARQLPRWPWLWRGTRLAAVTAEDRIGGAKHHSEPPSLPPPLSLLAWTSPRLTPTAQDWLGSDWMEYLLQLCLPPSHHTTPHHTQQIFLSQSRTQKTTANSTLWKFDANIISIVHWRIHFIFLIDLGREEKC